MALAEGIDRRSTGKALRPRLLLALWVVVACFLVLLARLYALQIMRGEELSSKGRRNFVQHVRVPHDRGIVYDRLGRILVDNRPSLNLQVTPAFLGDRAQRDKTLDRLAVLCTLSAEERAHVETVVGSRRGLGLFQPVLVKRDLSAAEVEAVEAERSVFLLDGVDIVEGRRRTYLHGTLAAHLFGYVNEIDGRGLDAERARGNPLGYEIGDLVGRDGVERTYERQLRGVDGYEKTVVDAKGRRQRGSYVGALLGPGRRVNPKPGHNLFLTIDLDLQRAAEVAFTGQAGSAVVLRPYTGAVLALVSVPAFDPNRVSGALAKEEKARLDADPLKPWVNRTIQGQYAPGSTFKIVTALAALEQRATSTREKVSCPGHFKLGRHTWRCHRDRGHGLVDLRVALKVSCDTFFYTMGARLGIDAIATVARGLGFGSPTRIPLRGEKPGLVPDEAYHDRVEKASGGYQRGMAVNTSIGQGALLVTPLQLAVSYAAVVNGGKVVQPQIVERVETADFRVTRRFLAPAGRQNNVLTDDGLGVPRLDAAGEDDGATGRAAALDRFGDEWTPGDSDTWAEQGTAQIREQVRGEGPQRLSAYTPQQLGSLDLSESHWRAVRAGLVAVTSEPGGTAYWRRSRKVAMAGKTGTAQVVRLGRERLDAHEMDYFERDHAWFAAYAPAEQPEIVVVVLNEHSGHGGSKAAPIAVSIIDTYMDLKQQRQPRAAARQTPAGRPKEPGSP